MILMDYYRYGFCVDVEIVDVKERVREDVLHEQNYRDVPMFMGNTGSMRVNDYDGRNYAPRFMSYKMPQSRDNSPYSYGSNQRLN